MGRPSNIAHPCKERKDGATSVKITIQKGGPAPHPPFDTPEPFDLTTEMYRVSIRSMSVPAER